MHAGTSGGSGKIEGRMPGGGHVDLAPLEHGHGVAVHGRLRLQMKVLEHGPTLPPTKEADATAVNTATEKCHGASGMEAASTDIIRPKYQIMPHVHELQI